MASVKKPLEASTTSSTALKMDMPLAKPGPVRNGGNACAVTDLRNQTRGSGAVLIPASKEEEVRTCEKNSRADTKVIGEGGEGGVPDARARQAMVHSMEGHGDAGIPLQLTEEEHTAEWVGA